MTREKFIAAYRAFAVANYAWTADAAKLDSFLSDSVEPTLSTERTLWIWDGPGSKAAWKAIGGKGKMTLKALRALPEKEI